MECTELAYTGNSQLHEQCDTKRPDILSLLLLSFLFSLILLPSNSFICLLSSFYRTLSVLHRIVFRAVRCSQTSVSLPDTCHNRPANNSFIHPGWLGSRVVSVLDSGAEGPGFKSQPRRCRVTVLGKLSTPIVHLFTKQRNW